MPGVSPTRKHCWIGESLVSNNSMMVFAHWMMVAKTVKQIGYHVFEYIMYFITRFNVNSKQ